MIVNGYEIKPGADLEGAYLRGANLEGADLEGAYLREADLRGANLRGANLREADLRRADLGGADLFRADLREANLGGADLFRADLREADLREANLREADLDFACWPLWCGTQDVVIDEKIAKQLLSHAFNVSLKYWPGKLNKKEIEWLNSFHRIESKEFPKF